MAKPLRIVKAVAYQVDAYYSTVSRTGRGFEQGRPGKID
jgi:ribosomal protein L13E